jgi:F-type H+-transporting ATPase subunit epsilon
VLPDRVRVLADVAERAEEIDVQRARTALERAHRDLDNPSLGVDPAAALAAAQRAQARLEAAQKA